MGQWHEVDGVQRLVKRLATAVLRAQRLLLAQRINQLESMVQIHAPSLKKEPGGEEKLQAMYKLCTDARTTLKEASSG